MFKYLSLFHSSLIQNYTEMFKIVSILFFCGAFTTISQKISNALLKQWKYYSKRICKCNQMWSSFEEKFFFLISARRMIFALFFEEKTEITKMAMQYAWKCTYDRRLAISKTAENRWKRTQRDVIVSVETYKMSHSHEITGKPLRNDVSKETECTDGLFQFYFSLSSRLLQFPKWSFKNV